MNLIRQVVKERDFMIRTDEVAMPTQWGAFSMIAYSEKDVDLMPQIALISQNFDANQPAFVRIHSECMTGDVFGSKRCDCGEQLTTSMKMIAENGGVLIYLRQEGRGIGLINKLKAYSLQEQGYNTADANTHLGLDVDAREYDMAVEILKDLNIDKIHLITNNPDKISALDNSPIEVVERVPIIIDVHKDNEAYMKTKKDLMGHLLNKDDK